MNPFNLSFWQAFKSKTIWAVVGAVALNGVNAAAADPNSFVAALHLQPNTAALVTAILGVVAVYGRMRPVQGVPGKDPKAS